MPFEDFRLTETVRVMGVLGGHLTIPAGPISLRRSDSPEVCEVMVGKQLLPDIGAEDFALATMGKIFPGHRAL